MKKNSELKELFELINYTSFNNQIKTIIEKVVQNERINNCDALELYQSNELPLLSLLSNLVRKRKNQQNTYFNKNIHIEPTNYCVYNCKFCSYRKKSGEDGGWEHSIEAITNKIIKYKNTGLTEIHIVGGVHPSRDFYFYLELIKKVKETLPAIQIKAFTAVELNYMFQKSGIAIEVGLQKLKEAGLVSLPGGGAEIFHPDIRKKICPQKATSEKWLEIHRVAHNLKIPTNATMLYGHIEQYEHRIHHLEQLRKLQDLTNGFQAFIPLKYRKQNNMLSEIGEVSVIEDLKNYAVTRIYLDNFDHIKAYWPMLGKEITKLALYYGVDDIDGTIDDSTQIYSMAGAEDKNPVMTEKEIVEIVKSAGLHAVERDTLYSEIKKYV